VRPPSQGPEQARPECVTHGLGRGMPDVWEILGSDVLS